MLLGPFNGLQNWQYAQISTQKSMPKLAKTKPNKIYFLKFFLGVFDTPKMLKSAPKWLKLMPEILKIPIFAPIQF
jgi:hypothetical protein